MSDRPASVWNTGHSLQLLAWGTGIVLVAIGSAYTFGQWRGAATIDPTETLKSQMVGVQAGVTALQTQNQAINTQLLELAGRTRQQELDLKRIEGSIAAVEKRGDDRDAQQDRQIEEQRKEQAVTRERLVVIERSSSGPLPGQPRR